MDTTASSFTARKNAKRAAEARDMFAQAAKIPRSYKPMGAS
jgi:hypothetical protein